MSTVGLQEVKIAEIFSQGSTVHLRISFGGLERMVPVMCLGVLEPDNILIVRWSDDAAARLNLPRIGQELACYVMIDGVLFIVQGNVIEVGEGQLPEIHCQLIGKCAANPLRRHQRYEVQGELTIGLLGQEPVFTATQPAPMDLSLGGLGADIPEQDWQVGQEVSFECKFWVDLDNRAAVEHPALVMEGRGIIRNIRADELGGLSIIGMEFANMSAMQMSALQMWIAAHVAFLREA